MSISNFFIFNNQEQNNGALEAQDKMSLKNPKKSGDWNLQFIHIDGNWSHTVGNYTWCSGDGSWA
ncbi:MAG: hypothetical protein ACFFDL_08620, partial [Promethearchaeota archaeon]